MPTPTYSLIPDQTASDVNAVLVQMTVQPETPPTPAPHVSQVTVAEIDGQIAALGAELASVQSKIDALNAQRAEVLAVAQTATLTPAQ